MNLKKNYCTKSKYDV